MSEKGEAIEMISRRNAGILADRWRDALHQIWLTPDVAIKDGRFTEDTIHRLLSVLLDEVVVAEGGRGRVPRSVPYRELEEKIRLAMSGLRSIEALANETQTSYSQSVAAETIKRVNGTK